MTNMGENLTRTPEFVTDQVFSSREEITAWVHNVGRSVGCVVITKRSKSYPNDVVYKVVFMCEHGGVYKSKKASSRDTGTRKFNCPFELIALRSAKYNWWTLRVVCDTHNHALAQYMEGHAYAMRLKEGELQLVEDLSAQHVKPRYILSTLKGINVENASTSKTIYNEVQKIRTKNDAGRPKMQVILDFFVENNYDFETHVNDETNELEDLFLMHPKSLELWRAFPQVLVIDATYKTNRFGMPLLEIVGVTSTNKTFCIAFVFMHQEKVSNYIWALECLKSKIYDNLYPGAIVTDRELALINACKVVFPDAKRLICIWHIYTNIMKHCKPQIHDAQSWNSFYHAWLRLLESPNQELYTYNLVQLQETLLNYPGVFDYLNNVWLTPYKEMIVSAWVDQFLHFGNHTTNRVESQHSKLKKYLETSKADLENFLSHIHQVIQSQITSIKASFETSKNKRKHRFQKPEFQNLWGLVSLYALDMIEKEHTRSRETHVFSENCGCIMRTGYGLPCAHEQALYKCQDVSIPLDAIDVFWKKLDFSPCASAQDDDIQCDDERQMFRENYNKQTISGRKTLLKKLKNIIMPSKPLFDEPSADRTTRGRPSQKNQALQKKIPEDPRRRSCSNAPTFINSQGFAHQESARHSSYFPRQPTPSNSYLAQIPSLFHPYITQIQDVLGDGNCGFRAISTCLGGHEDQWDDIRRELIAELTENQQYYHFVIGRYKCPRIYEALNFFQKGVSAPYMHWIVMPEMRILAASRFNVILHVLSMAGNVTYLPFRTPPPSSSQHVSIAIVHVNGNHYIKVVLNGEYPMPTLTTHWQRCRFPVASTWFDAYRHRLDMYTEYIERTRTREYVDLNE